MKKLAFGLMRLPQLDENDVTSIDIERVKGMVDTYMEQGFSYMVGIPLLLILFLRDKYLHAHTKIA